MTSRRTPTPNQAHANQIQNKDSHSQLRLIKYRPKLNHLLRSRCRVAFIIISILAMLVVVRSGINASRGYALVATQNQAQVLEDENARLRIEIAKLKSPGRIKQIAQEQLGMDVPKQMYFSHDR